MSGWINKKNLLDAVKTVTTTDPKGIECMQKRSEDVFDYTDFISSTLKFVAKNTVRKFGNSGQLLTKKKSNSESTKLREKATELLQLFNEENLTTLDETIIMKKFFNLYMKAIVFAVPNGQEMAICYLQRSAILLNMYLCKEKSLEDIERALNCNCTEEFKCTLLMHKALCFSCFAKDSYTAAKFWLKCVPANDSNRKKMIDQLKCHSTKDIHNRLRQEILLPSSEETKKTYGKKVESRADDEIPIAFDSIILEYSGPTGKKIIATRDIEVNELLAIEEPYLTSSFEKDFYLNCSYCSDQFSNGISCEGCVHVVYCSEECCKSAWEEYHNFECPIAGSLLQLDYSKKQSYLIGCARLLFKFSYESGGLEALKERIEKFQKCNDGDYKKEWYCLGETTMESVLSLPSYMKEISNEYFQMITVTTIQILFCLATATNFLGVQYKRNCMSDEKIILLMSQEPSVSFVGGLLMKIGFIIRYNNISLRGASEDDEMLMYCRSAQGPQGHITVLPFMGLFNASCYFNVIQVFSRGLAIMQSIAPIKKGEEILIRGAYSWIDTPKEKRELRALKKCFCKACEENWPTIDKLESFHNRAKTPEMIGILEEALKPLDAFVKGITVIGGNSNFLINKKHSDIRETLKNMMTAIHEGVNLPCKEQAQLLVTQSLYNYNWCEYNKLERFYP